MAHRSQNLATPRERRLSRVRSLFLWPQAGGQFEPEPEEETTPAVSDWTAPTSRAARRVSFLDVQDPREPPPSDLFCSVRNAHRRLSVPPVLDFLAPSGHNWNTMSVRSRRSKATPPPLDVPEDAIAGPSSSVATLPLPSYPPDFQSKSQTYLKRVLRHHGSFNALQRKFAAFSTRPGDRSSVESACSTSANSEHSLSGTTAYASSDSGDSEEENGKDVVVVVADAEEERRPSPEAETPTSPEAHAQVPFEGCGGLLELNRETNDVLSHIIPSTSPSFLSWHQTPEMILEIGCESGDWSIQAATAWPFSEVRGVDVHAHTDAEPNKRTKPANVEFTNCDFLSEGLPFGDNTFDYVRVANCQFRVRAQQWKKLLREVHRVLQVGGRLELIDEDLVALEESRSDDSQDDDDEPEDSADEDEPQSTDARLQRNAQDLETIFRCALQEVGFDSRGGHIHQTLQDAFGSYVAKPLSHELCASLPSKKTSKFFGAVPREECVILQSRLNVDSDPYARHRLSLDTRYALHGPDVLVECEEFIYSFVSQKLDAEGSPLVQPKDLDEAFWDYKTFLERRFLWRNRLGAAFDDDADAIIARSRPGPRRSDGGDTNSMVGSMRRAFERTNSAGAETHSFSSRRTLERSYSFDSDVTPRPSSYFGSSYAEPSSYSRWAPGDAYELNRNRTLVPLRRFLVYTATKEE
ncbi:unnamed protein product [Peniophora sp. CBMAI 1063]|nr:unnamed protein product [Peniophora sp. CBMAI 1063]